MAPDDVKSDRFLEAGLNEEEKKLTGPQPKHQTHRTSTMATVRRSVFALTMFMLVGLGFTAVACPHSLPCNSHGQDLSDTPADVSKQPSQSFSQLLRSASPESLHKLLHDYFPEQYQHGIWKSEHEAMEAVHEDEPSLATSLAQMAKRQEAGGDNSTSTPPGDDTTSSAITTSDVTTSTTDVTTTLPPPTTSSESTSIPPTSTEITSSSTTVETSSTTSSEISTSSSPSSSSTPSSSSSSGTSLESSTTSSISTSSSPSSSTISTSTLATSTSSSSSSSSSSLSSSVRTSSSLPVSTDATSSSVDEVTSTTEESSTQATVTEGSQTTSKPVQHTLTRTLGDGGTTTITSTSWVAVRPTDASGSSDDNDPDLQDAAAGLHVGIAMPALFSLFAAYFLAA